MSDSFQSAYQEEEYRLERTMEEVDSQLERLQNIPVYTGHDFTEQVLEAGREERRTALSKSAQQPYFGRLDFEEQGSGARKPLYIGKIGVDREEVESIRSSSTGVLLSQACFTHLREGKPPLRMKPRKGLLKVSYI